MVTDYPADALKALADIPPEEVYATLQKVMPDIVAGAEQMLARDVTPEWIFNRGDFLSIPPEIHTVVLNAFHWRKQQIEQEEGRGFRQRSLNDAIVDAMKRRGMVPDADCEAVLRDEARADREALEGCIEVMGRTCDCKGPRPTAATLSSHWRGHAPTCPYFKMHKAADAEAERLAQQAFTRAVVAKR